MKKIKIYPISNWDNCKYFINGFSKIIYKNIKYQIGIGYENNIIRFVLLSPDKLDYLNKFNESESFLDQKYISLDLNNYWEGCVALAEFNIVNI